MRLKLILISTLLLGAAFGVAGQDIKFAGTKAPDPGVLELLGKYEAASTRRFQREMFWDNLYKE